jgi:hypothetical protein
MRRRRDHISRDQQDLSFLTRQQPAMPSDLLAGRIPTDNVGPRLRDAASHAPLMQPLGGRILDVNSTSADQAAATGSRVDLSAWRHLLGALRGLANAAGEFPEEGSPGAPTAPRRSPDPPSPGCGCATHNELGDPCSSRQTDSEAEAVR